MDIYIQQILSGIHVEKCHLRKWTDVAKEWVIFERILKGVADKRTNRYES